MEGLVDLSLFEWNPTGNSSAHGVSSGAADYYQPVWTGSREYYAPSPRTDIKRETDDLREAIRRSMNDSTSHAADTRQPATVHDDSDIRETVVDASRRKQRAMRPLPMLPRTRFAQPVAAADAAAAVADDGPSRILSPVKPTTADQAVPSPGSLLQRRNTPATPQLTLSIPHESPKPSVASKSQQPHHAASPMVWMPDEQMWLIVGEAEQRTAQATPSAYPTPPAYTPRAFARSEPSSRVTSQWNLTPPQTPIQSQLQSLLQPRDEERLSPLFQEAMNSVPMTDHFDLPPPPSYEGTVRRSPPTQQFRPHTSASEHFLASDPQSSSSASPFVVQRAQTTGGQRPRVRSDTSNERSISQRSYSSTSTNASMRPSHGGRSYHSASTSRSYQSTAELLPAQSSSSYQPVRIATRSWHGLAQRLARPKSTT